MARCLVRKTEWHGDMLVSQQALHGGQAYTSHHEARSACIAQIVKREIDPAWVQKIGTAGAALILMAFSVSVKTVVIGTLRASPFLA